MTTQNFPGLDPVQIEVTRDALHNYAAILGDWLKACRPQRKHWWHASLRPSLNGLTTGVVHAGIGFELELNLNENLLQMQTSLGQQSVEPLDGRPASELAEKIQDFLLGAGVDKQLVPAADRYSNDEFAGYSAAHAVSLASALNSVSAAMQMFRAGIKQETSPIQLWPHHFDLSMLWLPGDKIPGQDPDNEEYSDQQMNYGFTFGDAGIPEPYFYVTAYPLPDAFPALEMPVGSQWLSEGFSGAVLLYRELIQNTDPSCYLREFWGFMLAAGREHMPATTT